MHVMRLARVVVRTLNICNSGVERDETACCPAIAINAALLIYVRWQFIFSHVFASGEFLASCS